MLVLVVDTSTPAVTAAVVPVGEPTDPAMAAAATARTVDARRHGELLAPSIRSVLAESGHGVDDLSAVVAGVGPGPFTGLRVGLVTAAAIASARGIPAYGVCSLDGVGAPGRTRLVATDARRAEVYWAVYDARGRRVVGPSVDRPEVVAARCAELGVESTTGDGAYRYAEILGRPVDGYRYPDPAALAELARERIRSGVPSETLTPLYLRRPDATVPGAAKRVSPPGEVSPSGPAGA